MIGFSSKENTHFFNTSKSIDSFLDFLKSGNIFYLLTGVLWDKINRSIDPLDDGPTQNIKKISVFINFRPAARLITGNIFSKKVIKFFEKISGDYFSKMIFFHAKDLPMSFFFNDTSPGVKCSTGSYPQNSSKHPGMEIIKRAVRITTPVFYLNNISNSFILSSVRQSGIYF